MSSSQSAITAYLLLHMTDGILFTQPASSIYLLRATAVTVPTATNSPTPTKTAILTTGKSLWSTTISLPTTKTARLRHRLSSSLVSLILPIFRSSSPSRGSLVRGTSATRGSRADHRNHCDCECTDTSTHCCLLSSYIGSMDGSYQHIHRYQTSYPNHCPASALLLPRESP